MFGIGGSIALYANVVYYDEREGGGQKCLYYDEAETEYRPPHFCDSIP